MERPLTLQQATDQIKELQDTVKGLINTVKETTKTPKMDDSLYRQDCGFDRLNSTSWRKSGVADVVKKETDAWKRSGGGETFYQYIYKAYAPGLADSQTHCNGRGHCGVTIDLHLWLEVLD